MTNAEEIKPALPHQLELIQELAYEIWPVHYSGIISMNQIEYMLRLLYSLPALEEQVAQGHSFYILWNKETAIGFLGIKDHGEGDLKIEKLYLKQEFRGSGLGKKMINFALEHAKNMGFTSVILNVNRLNPSFEFYKKAGFSIRHQVDIPFGPFWLNDYVMEMPVGEEIKNK
jgi:ribosomal protein S18 acetylase RimI-like enzyme